MKTEIKYRELSASDLTAFALEMMRLQNYRVRRVNNVAAYKKRRNHVEKGWPDIQGYASKKDGAKAVLCEVKKNGDSFSTEQLERLMDLHECGGIAMVCVQVKGNAEVIPFIEYYKTLRLHQGV